MVAALAVAFRAAGVPVGQFRGLVPRSMGLRAVVLWLVGRWLVVLWLVPRGAGRGRRRGRRRCRRG